MSTPISVRRSRDQHNPHEQPMLVLIGGVPGAGKSTLLARSAPGLPGVRALDPETDRTRLSALLPTRIPYRSYRGLVHTAHAIRTLTTLLDPGPDPELRAVLVHEPATRPIRRALLARLARAQGWRPVLVLLDVSRDDALAGQQARSRVLNPPAFARHWERWSTDRDHLLAAAADRQPMDGWDEVHVVDRASAERQLRELLYAPAPRSAQAEHGRSS